MAITQRSFPAILAILAILVVAASAPAAAAEPGGTREGIQVHGHWKIEVFDPDGTRISAYEFENAFVGSAFLTDLLAGRASQGLWGIWLDAVAVATPCLDDLGQDAQCKILEPGDTAAANHFLNLTVAGTSSLVLAGSATAGQSTSIDTVTTMLSTCGPTVAPASCTASAAASGSAFTMKSLGTVVPVLAGQIVQVTVTISFS
jgi:hypothetical protein